MVEEEVPFTPSITPPVVTGPPEQHEPPDQVEEGVVEEAVLLSPHDGDHEAGNDQASQQQPPEEEDFKDDRSMWDKLVCCNFITDGMLSRAFGRRSPPKPNLLGLMGMSTPTSPDPLEGLQLMSEMEQLQQRIGAELEKNVVLTQQLLELQHRLRASEDSKSRLNYLLTEALNQQRLYQDEARDLVKDKSDLIKVMDDMAGLLGCMGDTDPNQLLSVLARRLQGQPSSSYGAMGIVAAFLCVIVTICNGAASLLSDSEPSTSATTTTTTSQAMVVYQPPVSLIDQSCQTEVALPSQDISSSKASEPPALPCPTPSPDTSRKDEPSATTTTTTATKEAAGGAATTTTIAVQDVTTTTTTTTSAPAAEEMVARCEHPKYSIYYKKLKLGLPVPAVLRIMENDGIAKSFIDSFASLDANEIIPVNDQGPPMATSCGPSPLRRLPAIPKKFKVFHTKEVDGHRVKATTGVFAAAASIEFLAFDLKWMEEELPEKLDCVEALKAKKDIKSATGAGEVTIDKKASASWVTYVQTVTSQRRQNTFIALKKVTLSVHLIRDHLMVLSEDLSIDRLESLRDILPKNDELDQLRKIEKDASLDLAGQFMVEMAHLPMAKKRVMAMLYMRHFTQMVEVLAIDINKSIAVCGRVQSSTQIPTVLRYVMEAINMLNKDSSCKAMCLANLELIRAKRVPKKAFNLLQFLMRERRELLMVKKDLEGAEEVIKKGPLVIREDLKKLEAGFDVVKAVAQLVSAQQPSSEEAMARLAAFIQQAGVTLKSLRKDVHDMTTKVAELLLYFGEPQTQSLEGLLQLLNNFVKDMEQSMPSPPPSEPLHNRKRATTQTVAPKVPRIVHSQTL